MLHNPRTTLLGKLFGLGTYPINLAAGNLGRGSHYNPATDVATQYYDIPAVTQHELGHAIDFNRHTPSQRPGIGGALRREGTAAARDLYTIGRVLPGMPLWQEAMANKRSYEGLRKVLKGEKLQQALHDRLSVLPAGYGSYVGGEIGRFLGPAGTLLAVPGAIAGKVIGHDMQDAARLRERDKKSDKDHNRKDEK